MKILFTGGGTAGHIFPIIAIVREIKKSYPYLGYELFYLGPKDKFSRDLLSREGIEVKTILAGKFRRYFSFKNIIDIFKLPVGILQAFYHIFVISPDLIFSKGGYGSIPAILSGWILQVPIFLHESDVTPGLANRIAGRFALEIFTAFPVRKIEYFPARKIISVGNPIRMEILDGLPADFVGRRRLRRPKAEARRAKAGAKLKTEKPVILILGGSQGAQKINNTLLVVLPNILRDFEVIHQTGKRNFEQVKKEANVIIPDDLKQYYHCSAFLNEKELANAYATADLVISRAGAGTIFEIAAIGKPSILIPLAKAAQNHQVKNAYAFAENGASIVIEKANFRPHFLLERIKYLFSQPQKLEEMAKKAKEFSRPQASRIISEYLVTYLSQ